MRMGISRTSRALPPRETGGTNQMDGAGRGHRDPLKSVGHGERTADPPSSHTVREGLLGGAGAGEDQRTRADVTKTVKIVDAVLALLAFLGLGFNFSVLCQTLLDLERLTSSGTEKMATVYVSRACGVLLGSIVLGPVFDRFNHSLLLAASMALVGVTQVAIPHWNRLVAVSSLFGIQGIGVGAASVGTTLVLVKHWQKRSGPFFQAMYLMYTIAGFTSPFLINSFTKSVTKNAKMTSLNMTDGPHYNVLQNTGNHLRSNSSRQILNASRFAKPEANLTMLETALNSTQVISVPDIRYPYAITGILIVVIGVAYIFLAWHYRTFGSIWSKRKSEPTTRKPSDLGRKRLGFDLSNVLRVIMFYILLTLEMGVECAFSGLCVSFLVEHLQWRQGAAVYATSVLFFTNGATRLLAIPVSRFVQSRYLVLFNCVLSTVGMFIMATLLPVHPSMIWVSIILVGIAFSTTYPSTLTWASTEVKVSGRVTSVFIAPLATGLLVGTTVISYVFGKRGPIWFTYMLCLYMILIDIMWVIAFIVTKLYPYKPENVTEVLTGSPPETKKAFLPSKAEEANMI